MKKGTKIAIGVVAVLIIGGAIASQSNDSENNTPATTEASSDVADTTDVADTSDAEVEPTEEAIEYTKIKVDKLDKALKDNALNAKNEYDGKYLEITGKLSTIDASGAYIALNPVKESYNIVNTIQCYIQDDTQLNTISKMKKDDVITLKVKITDVGEIMGYAADIIEIE